MDAPDPRRRRLLTGQLATGIAHDFNNILATVLGSLELMERRLDRLPQEEQDRFARLIRRSTDAVQKAGIMTSGLLAFARREPQPAEPIHLAQFIPDLLALARGALGRRVQTSHSFPDALPLIHADRARLELALLGLILAIREAMPEGGHLAISASHGPTHIELTFDHAGTLPDHFETDLADLLSDLNAALAAEQARTVFTLPVS